MRGCSRNLVLVACDLMTVVMAWVVALLGYDVLGGGTYRYSFYLRLWPVAVVFVLLNALFRLYHGRFFQPAAPVPPIEELRRLIGSAAIAHLGLIAVIAIARQTTVDYSRAAMLIAGVLTALLAQPVRDLARAIMLKCRVGLIPVHLLAAGADERRLTETFASDAYTGFAVRKGGVADIVVVCMDTRKLKHKMTGLLRRYTHIEFVPADGAFPISGGHVFSFSGVAGIEMINQRRFSVLKAEKRLLDMALTLLTFLLVSPLFVVVPVLIKLTSRGPVFYRQERRGRAGVRFRVWKFRSMYVDADERLENLLAQGGAASREWAVSRKLSRDPRVTPLGRFLRKTSIDEFPQLFNVFLGDMALVGPRPIVDEEVRRYGDSYKIMSCVRPGVTGLWQVSGRSGTDYDHRVALDTQYVLNWSPWLDIWVVIRTAISVLLMRGAC